MPLTAAFCGDCGAALKGQAESPVLPDSTPEPRAIDVAGTSTCDMQVQLGLSGPPGSLRGMVLIPGCSFLMGAVGDVFKDDEVPRHSVRLSSFYIDRCAVTNIEFERFSPNHARHRPSQADKANDPVVFVTHADCLAYCRWRSQQEGLPDDAYSLPTEAQWECAARGGLPDTIYPWGNELRAERYNTRETGLLRTRSVNEGFPNGFQLLWMGSNVREWCLDWYQADYYRKVPDGVLDPPGPDPTLIVNLTVVRGASYQDPAYELARCSARNFAHRDNSANDMGFRCVRKAK